MYAYKWTYKYTFLQLKPLSFSLFLFSLFKFTCFLLSFLLKMHPHQYSNMNNGYGEDSNSCCYFHPKEVVVGVCPLCLNERLVVLASKQERTRNHRSKVFSDKKQQQSSAATSINLPKIFAFGSLLNRFEFRHWKSDVSDEHDACSSQEGMLFIIIIILFLSY